MKDRIAYKYINEKDIKYNQQLVEKARDEIDIVPL